MTSDQSQRDPPVSAGLGVALRAARKERGLSLTELSTRTKIRADYLTALEEERFDSLPPYPFVRGFLQTYAIELGLDPEPLLVRLGALTPPSEPAPIEEARRLETAIKPARPLTPRQRGMRTAGIVGVVVVILLGVYGARQLQELSQPVPAPTPQGAAPSPSGPAPQASVPESPVAQTTAAEATPQPQAAPQPQASPIAPAGATTQVTGSGITIDVEATGRSWIRVVADDALAYEGFVTAGEQRRWQAKGSMTVRVGNAGAIAVRVNGKSVGSLGGRGEVVSRTFRRDDVR